MTELEHIADTHCRRLVELLTCTTIVEVGLTEAGKTGLVGPSTKVFEFCTVEDGGSKLDTQLFSGTSQYGLEYLTDVHT